MNVIHDYQKDNERGEYDIHFYPFGDSDDMKHRGTRQIGPQARMTQFSKGICEFSGITEPDDPPAIRVLRAVEDEDFLVFFCRTRSVRLNINVARQYVRAKNRSAWFFLAEDEPQWEPGSRFRPDLFEVESSPN